MKTAEMKIQFYTDGKRKFCRVLMFDNRKLIFRDVSCVDNEVLALLAHAENVREKFESGGFDRVKMLKNSEYGVMLNAKK